MDNERIRDWLRKEVIQIMLDSNMSVAEIGRAMGFTKGGCMALRRFLKKECKTTLRNIARIHTYCVSYREQKKKKNE